MAIRTIIVDDEPLARDKTRRYLEREADVEVIDECRDGKEALEKIERLRPNLVFLDVQMPELDGFEVLESLDPAAIPAIVFVTAFDQYAIRAFDVHAVDYLLKPFDAERFTAAMDRAREVVGQPVAEDAEGMEDRLRRLLDEVRQQKPAFPERLVVKSSGRVVFIRVEQIDWIDAAGNYVKLNLHGGESHLLRETMAGLERRLDPQKFLRIHRSTIINVDRIQELQQQFHGDYLVVLEDGQRLTLSRSYRERLQELIGRSI